MPKPMSVACALTLAMATMAADAADRPLDRGFATRSEVIGANGMVATSHPLATQIGLEVLKAGGTAMDAAIAANAALGLMEPTGCGIGGDLFAIVWDPKTKRLHGYNGSGRSPQSLTRAWFDEEGIERIPSFGPLPVTVPGAVDGWFALHGRFGRKPMAELLAPTVRYAREGHPVPAVIAEAWAISVRRYAEFEGFKAQFTIDGRAPGKGEIWKNPNLARTLERIGREGRDAFYRGEIPEVVERYMKAQGGFLAASDFAAHRGEWVDPVAINYRGVDVWQIPPNGQGIAGLQILKMMEGFDLAGMSPTDPRYVHRFVEAKKLAFEDRARWYADPAFFRSPVADLLSERYAAERRKLIDPERAQQSVAPGNPVLDTGDTIYLATADKDGMMVSLIQSNYRGMGSGMTPPGLGFMLQNRGEQFALLAGHPNEYAPAKRPFHTIIPGFATKDGEPWLAFGVMGGAMQPQGHAQVIINLVDFGLNLQEAGDAPRIHHGGSTEPEGKVVAMADGGVVNLESAFPHETRRELLRLGHRLQDGPVSLYGGYQAVMRDPKTGVYFGASESRKDGHAAGY
jgi:gamma-glutamyltranspeptidase/glutathione hydrolase